MGDDGPQNILWGYLHKSQGLTHSFCFNTITTPCFSRMSFRFGACSESLMISKMAWEAPRVPFASTMRSPTCWKLADSRWQHCEIIRSQSWTKDMLRRFPYYTILWIYVYYTTFWGVASGHETVCPNEWRWLFEILWHCYHAPRVVREWYHFDEKHQGRYFDTQICSTGPYQIWLCFFSLWPSTQVLSCYSDNIEKSE